jgi:hypothetical protein
MLRAGMKDIQGLAENWDSIRCPKASASAAGDRSAIAGYM